ncbi:MAG TPA: 4'-phosphopantetheinyl transferase superfamily protein [Mucilaginibacter sp.]|jgi:phosphopantetheinyl transferase (holo-ACP synthase)|nr:4'-phosphopantetheinyl transferase superfamily protein [Mucilaginibacter sp.]
MNSAGNDIVSLTATNVTRTKSPEFYSKIISPAEKALFDTLDHEVLPFDRFVWLLWSVKESAYKYLHRLNANIVFTPVKFEVRAIGIPQGYCFSGSGFGEFTDKGFNSLAAFNAEVFFSGKKLFAKVVIHQEFVSSVVNHTDSFDGIYWGIKQIADTSHACQSAAVREFILAKLGEISGLDGLSIYKNENDVPVLLNNGELLQTPISLSHHERWIAYSFQSPLTTGN